MADGTHVDLGHAMITMVEPTSDPDRLREYNRWYEHDHCYSGVMVGPWAFSYGRFVATRRLKDLRFPAESSIASPVDQGSFIGLYWYLAGKIDEHFAWSFPATQQLAAEGRMNGDRTHISTSLYDFRGVVNRPGWPVPAEVSLDHRYAGLVTLWIDRTEASTADALASWLLTDHLPWVFSAPSALASALVFAPRDFPGVPGTGVGVDEKVLVTLFVQGDPADVWESHIAPLEASIAAGGHGTVGLAAGFIPVVPGTETYLDQLW
jgi:hypothetical protein